MGNSETSAIIGLKHELKASRAKVRGLAEQNGRWRRVADALREIAGLSDAQYANLVKTNHLSLE